MEDLKGLILLLTIYVIVVGSLAIGALVAALQ